VWLSLCSFADPPRSVIYALSLHDALPICAVAIDDTPKANPAPTRSPSAWFSLGSWATSAATVRSPPGPRVASGLAQCEAGREGRSEEHTSELQSRFELVCRLLLEKKNGRI